MSNKLRHNRRASSLPKLPLGAPIPSELWSRVIEILQRYTEAGETWVEAGRPRSGPLSDEFEAADTDYQEMADQVILRGQMTPEQRKEWEMVSVHGRGKRESSITITPKYVQYKGAVYREADLKPWSRPSTKVDYQIERAVEDYMDDQYPDAEQVDVRYRDGEVGPEIFMLYQDDDHDYGVEITLNYQGLLGELISIDVAWYVDGKPAEPPPGFPGF